MHGSCRKRAATVGLSKSTVQRIWQQIHIIFDNLSAHKTKAVAEFLEANSKVRFHFTPTYSSWLNQVEIWFSRSKET